MCHQGEKHIRLCLFQPEICISTCTTPSPGSIRPPLSALNGMYLNSRTLRDIQKLYYHTSQSAQTSLLRNAYVFSQTKNPWITSAVQSLLRSRDAAFRSGDRVQYSLARANLRRDIRAAKEEYKRKIEDHLSHNNSRHVWQGLHQLTNFKGSSPVSTRGDASSAEELNSCFAHFEMNRPLSTQHQAPTHHPRTSGEMSAGNSEPQEGSRTGQSTWEST